MASNNSSQKFIGKNRAPRVQVEYDVELYGAEKKVNLPFVMGVMADLSGKSEVTKDQRVEDKKFLDIDADNFDDRMKSIKPRVAFNVPNVMTEVQTCALPISFESMDDFSPDKVAEKVDGVKELLEARRQLSNLLSYMDGKTGAEELITKLLEDETLLKALASKAKPKTEENKAEE